MAFRVSVTQARARLGNLMRRVAKQREAVIVERRGQPWVVLIPFEDYEAPCPTERAKTWQETLDRLLTVGAQIRAARAGRPLPPPEEMIQEMREERHDQFVGLH